MIKYFIVINLLQIEIHKSHLKPLQLNIQQASKNMDKLDMIDYIIKDKTKYMVDGKIDSMRDKKGQGWTSKVPDKEITFELKLKNQSFVNQCQIVPKKTHIVDVVLFSQKKKVIDQHKVVFTKQEKKKISFKSSSQPCSNIRVTVENDFSLENKIGLKNLMFYGIVFKDLEQNNPKKLKKKILTQDEEYQFALLKLNPKTKQKGKSIIQNRKRNKEKTKKQTQKPFDQDFQLAMELNRIQQLQKQERDNKFMKQTINHYEYQDVPELHQLKYYETCDFKEVQDVYKSVNPKWVEAQRKIEQEKGVIEKQKLSKKIIVKHLYQKSIMVDFSNYLKRKKYQKIAEELGAKIVNQIQPFCLIIAQKNDSNTVQKGLKVKGVKIVQENYLEECKQFGAEMNISDYLMKVNKK